jgi:kinesin family protein 6/9
LFSYGQTGAGKTYTVLGESQDSFEHRGVIPRVISDIFREIQNRPDMSATIRVSYFEINNDQMSDLLLSASTSDNFIYGSELMIMEDNLSCPIVTSEEEAFNFLFKGEMNRAKSQRRNNHPSSRSHCIFTVYLELRSKKDASASTVVSKLSLVDLAGSEGRKTHMHCASLAEANCVDESLTSLERVCIRIALFPAFYFSHVLSSLSSFLHSLSAGPGSCQQSSL